MANNLTIESPNFEKIAKEAGQFTSDAINILWAALNDTRKNLRIDFRRASNTFAPAVLTIAPSASVDNLDLGDASVISFTGADSVNFTGMKAPETGSSRLVLVNVSGSGTITAKHEVTSESANRLHNSSGADATLATDAGIIYLYAAGKWREIA